MAKIPTFDAQAPRRPMIEVAVDDSASRLFAQIAGSAGRITDRLTKMAGEAAQREGREAGARDALAVTMPGVDFAYSGTSATTRPAASVPTNAGAVKSYLMSRHGLTDFQAAAITGHLIQESGLRPTGAVGDQGTAFGLAQWRHDRFDNLKKFAQRQGKDWGDWQVQLDFIAHEMDTTERRAGEAFRGATNLDEATAAFMHFERPAGWSWNNPRGGHAWDKRLANAQALMQAGSARAQASPASAPATQPTAAPAPRGQVSVTLSGAAGPVPRAQAGTLRGDAYNQAASDIHLNRLDTAMRAQMDAIATQHPGDPAGLKQALDALKEGYVSELPPELQARVQMSFERHQAGHVASAANEFRKQVESQNLASFEEVIQQRTTSAMRIAATAGMNTEADAQLAAELDQIDRDIEASPLNPLQKSRLRRETRNQAIGARILGAFENIEDPAERAQYLAAFEEEWKAGEGFGGLVDTETFHKVKAEMVRQAKADEVEARQRATALTRAVDGQLSLLKKGWPVPPAERDRLAAEIASTGDEELAANLEFVDQLAAWQAAHLSAHPRVVEAQMAELRNRIQREGATPAALATLDVMEGLHKEMERGLREDPLGWARRAGVAEIPPIDLTDPEGLTASLAARAATAEAVGGHYGADPKYFTPAEAEAMRKLVEGEPLSLPTLISAINAGLGDAMPKAVAEISKEAPVLAHLATLHDATGDQRVTLEAAEALEMRRQEGYQRNLPSNAQIQAVANEAIGGALWMWPDARAAAIETATLIFERRAARFGTDISNFNQPGDAARLAFAQAVDEALGATIHDGVKFGGLTSVNGFETVAPSDMPAHEFEGLILNLTEDDLIFQNSPPQTVNGVPVSVSQIRRGRLIHAGGDRYRVALGDPMSDDPRFLADGEGGYWTLDASMLRSTREGRVPGFSWQGDQRWREWHHDPSMRDQP